MAIEVRLLGTVEARRDGAPVDLRGARQRRLLAHLSLVPGRPRPIDTVCEAVWPDGDAPDDPRATLHTYVSRLRSALGGAGTVVARDGGYVLEVDRDAVDAHRFEELVSSAVTLEPAESVDRFTAALRLWHGAALQGFESEDWARPHAVRLEELRANAVDERAERLLGLGRPAAAVADLEAAVLAQPLRDRTHRLLVTALHRTGRQAEALRVAHEFRARLATDVGLEPSEAMRALEAEVAGDGSPTAGPASPKAVRSYELGERIGDGAFAVVYRGRQPSVGREVAVKVIRAELANRPEFVRRFEAEAHLVARLEHPHVVPLYDYWREPGSAYLVMRLLRGGTLEDAVVERPLGAAEVSRMMTQVGSALAAAHRAGVVHRDVKSANIFLDGDGNYFLGDFGIAYEIAAPYHATDSLSIGSPAYASPEQLRREPVGPTADVHGLGIATYEALTGELPFPEARTRAELLARQLNDPLPPVRARRPELRADVDTVLARATAKDPADRYGAVDAFVDDLVAALTDGAPLVPAARPGAATALAEHRNPYKGLRAFQEADAADFCGRQRLVARIVERMAGDQPADRFVTVIGPSGSGKSSAVRAGVLPALRTGAVPGSGDWFVTSMVPGAYPFEELEAALQRVASATLSLTGDGARPPSRGIARAVKQAVASEDGELLLVIDQFEELFTLCADDAVRQRFIAELVEAVSDPRSRLRVIATLRADFYDRPLRYPELAPLLEASAVTVTPLAADELELAIVEPATRAGSAFEPGLVARIAADVVDQPGALPLLQYALTELFERQVSGLLTVRAYDELGGLAGALARRAEELFAAGSEPQQTAARRLFTRLVTLGEGTEDTRRHVRRSELGDDDATAAVIERFGAARLLSFDRDPLSREPTVEVAHEALIREWRRLRGWLDDDRDGLRVHRHLTTSAAGWEASGRDRGELYRGGRLEAAEQWLTSHPDEPNEVEAAFVVASVAQRSEERATAERGQRRVRRALVAVAAVAVLALVAGALAFQQRGSARSAAAEAQRQRTAAETGRLAALAPTLADTDLSLSMLIAAEAAGREVSPETLGALQRVIVAADNHLGFIPTASPLRSVFYADTDRLVGFTDTELIVWDETTHERVNAIAIPEPLPDRGFFNPVRASFADGRAAWVDASHTARTVRIDRQDTMKTIANDAAAVAVHPDGARVAIAGLGGDVRLIGADAGNSAWTIPGDGASTADEQTAVDLSSFPALAMMNLREFGLQALLFDRGGQRLVHADGVLLHDIDAAAGRRTLTLDTVHQPPNAPNHTWSSARIALAADREPRFIASAAVAASTYDASTWELRSRFNPLRRQNNFPAAVASLPEGRLAVLDSGGELAVVDERDGALLDTPISARVGQGNSLAVAPDGSHIVVAGDEGAVVLALDGGGAIRRGTPRGESTDVVFGRDGSSFANGTPYWECPPFPAPCHAVEVELIPGTLGYAPGTPFGVVHKIAEVHTIQLFDNATKQPVSPLIVKDGIGQSGGAVDPKGGWVAFDNSFQQPPDTSPTFQANAVSTGERLAKFPISGRLSMATPPSGDFILVGQLDDGESFVVDTETWEKRPSGLPPGAVTVLTFSPDGRFLATIDLAGDISLRDARSFALIRTFQGDAGAANTFAGLPLAFSDDGRYLVSAHDGRGRLWDVATGQPIGQPIDSLTNATPTAVDGTAVGFGAVTEKWVHYWRFDPDTWPATACRLAGRNMTTAEWEQFGPRDQPYHPTCPQWPTA